MYPPLDHWAWLIPAIMIGACIGSFLNVVIYRVPLGLSVNDPNRSFCPLCKNPISISRNIPVISWLLLRGKCGDCQAPIPFRYIGVEILTAILFGLVWLIFPPLVILFLWILIALLVTITFIDAEHLIIPTNLTWAGSAFGLIACSIYTQLPVLAGIPGPWWQGLSSSAIGWIVGFFGLWAVVELGKKAFGKKELKFQTPTSWLLKEPEHDNQPMLFIIGEIEIPWWDIFSRKTDRLLVETTEIILDGETVAAGQLIIRADSIELADRRTFQLEDMKSLSGNATSAIIPREAMGMGDVHLLGMIGAFFGWSGVFFSLFAASLFAIFAALIGRIGFGKQLPFGPFLALGAAAWMFGGWKIWAWYLMFVGF